MQKSIPIRFGAAVRTLRYGFNAQAAIQRACRLEGIPLADLNPHTAEGARILLWAGLLHEDKALTLDDVGDMIDEAGGLESVMEAVAEATDAAAPDPDDVRPPKAQGSRSKSSGPSRSTTSGSRRKRSAS